MYCQHCGSEIADESDFCRHCGEELTANSEPETTEAQPTNPEPEESETSLLKKLGYWGGRIVQIVLVLLAVIFVAGGFSMNILAFAALGIFALVLLGIAGAIEILVIRPSSR